MRCNKYIKLNKKCIDPSPQPIIMISRVILIKKPFQDIFPLREKPMNHKYVFLLISNSDNKNLMKNWSEKFIVYLYRQKYVC